MLIKIEKEIFTIDGTSYHMRIKATHKDGRQYIHQCCIPNNYSQFQIDAMEETCVLISVKNIYNILK